MGGLTEFRSATFRKGLSCFANNVEDKEGEKCGTREGMEEEE